MFIRLSARANVFLFVRSHLQLQYYLRVRDTNRAANDRGTDAWPGAALRTRARRKVVEIHPLDGSFS